MSLLAELRRRNVIRMAGLYLVGAWLIVQVSSTLTPMFSAPDWLPRTIVMLLVIGFVPALIFAWVFELTPDGIKRDAEVRSEESISPHPGGTSSGALPKGASFQAQTARRMDRILLLVSVLAVGYFAFDKFVLAPRREVALVKQTTQQVTDKANSEKSAINPNSIAVLPFVNMSGEAQNEYFSDGISEELLNVLARAPDLQVAARTSSFSFKGGKKEVPEIARELKVRMVLEGSVRKQGERVRITAQLIDASNGFHLWSQTYDRELKDIFAIQDEIASAIAAELQVKLGNPAAPAQATGGTQSVEAHDAYLRGLSLWQRRGRESLHAANEQFERAATIDPAFALAYSGQALVWVIIGDYDSTISYAESFARARDMAERTLALDATLPDPFAVLGALADSDERWDTAQELYRHALRLRPSFATASQWLGNSLLSAGKLDQAIVAHEQASLHDPRASIIANNHAWALIVLGRYADAKALCEPRVDDPNYAGCAEMAGYAELLLGHLEAARTLLRRHADRVNPSGRATVDAVIDALQGRGDRHALAVHFASFGYQSAYEPGSGVAFDVYEIPMMLVLLGEAPLAIPYLEQFVGHDANGKVAFAVQPVYMDPIRCEPRFTAIVRGVKASDSRYATVCGAKK